MTTTKSFLAAATITSLLTASALLLAQGYPSGSSTGSTGGYPSAPPSGTSTGGTGGTTGTYSPPPSGGCIDTSKLLAQTAGSSSDPVADAPSGYSLDASWNAAGVSTLTHRAPSGTVVLLASSRVVSAVARWDGTGTMIAASTYTDAGSETLELFFVPAGATAASVHRSIDVGCGAVSDIGKSLAGKLRVLSLVGTALPFMPPAQDSTSCDAYELSGTSFVYVGKDGCEDQAMNGKPVENECFVSGLVFKEGGIDASGGVPACPAGTYCNGLDSSGALSCLPVPTTPDSPPDPPTLP